MKNLAGRLRQVPDRPGIYMFKDHAGKVIYVGKAKALKKRVSSYFTKHPDSQKTASMLSSAEDFDYIAAASEEEALILENNFIKKYRPRYNILLLDDKQYPYIKLTVNEDWPRMLLVRKIDDDGAKYFGPYSGNTVRETLRLIKRLFPIRLCKETPMKMRKQPCMYFYIKRCSGPCLGGVDRNSYAGMIEEVRGLLEGRLSDVISKMRSEMKAASDRTDFEEAKALRDRIRSLGRMSEEQLVVSHDLADRDVVAFSRQGAFSCAVIFKVRGGKLVERDIFYPKQVEDATDEDLSASILKQYYSSAALVPGEILLAMPIKEAASLAELIRKKSGTKTKLIAPTRGNKAKLVKMAQDNATLLLERRLVSMSSDAEQPALLELKKKLNLSALPMRIEAFDISNISGTDTVGSMVVFVGGSPLKKDYRRFRVRSREGEPDDTGSIYEVVRRRYGGALSRELDRPELILIDGGIGQVGAAVKALKDAGKFFPPLIGLAKKHEEIFLPGKREPLRLPRSSKALQLLQRVRDEAHRFAVIYHRLRRSKRMTGKG